MECSNARWRHIPFFPAGLFWDLPQALFGTLLSTPLHMFPALTMVLEPSPFLSGNHPALTLVLEPCSLPFNVSSCLKPNLPIPSTFLLELETSLGLVGACVGTFLTKPSPISVAKAPSCSNHFLTQNLSEDYSSPLSRSPIAAS